MIVGAPQAKYSVQSEARLNEQTTSNHPADTPGAIYACPISRNKPCKRIPLTYSTIEISTPDSKGHVSFRNLHENSNCSNQWLGASLKASADSDGEIIACAPRWKQTWGLDGDRSQFQHMMGQCWMIKYDPYRQDFINDAHLGNKYFLTPSRNNGTFFNINFRKGPFYRYAAFGTSIGMSKNGEDLTYALGGPGSFSFSGGFYGADKKSTYTDLYRTKDCKTSDQVALDYCEPQDLSLSSYNGYSLAISEQMFVSPEKPKSRVFVSGAPNYEQTGMVIFTEKQNDELVEVGRIAADKILKANDGSFIVGTSFGFSIALADLNGDDLDDLVVGIPQYSL